MSRFDSIASAIVSTLLLAVVRADEGWLPLVGPFAGSICLAAAGKPRGENGQFMDKEPAGEDCEKGIACRTEVACGQKLGLVACRCERLVVLNAMAQSDLHRQVVQYTPV